MTNSSKKVLRRQHLKTAYPDTRYVYQSTCRVHKTQLQRRMYEAFSILIIKCL